jgi:hypothetical protein
MSYHTGMGMFDTVVFLDGAASVCCAEGHPIRSLQTKDLDEPSMNTYLVQGGRLYLARSGEPRSWADEASGWRVEGRRAVREHRFELLEVQAPRIIRVYGHCDECEPLLVRSDRASFLGDFVTEHQLFVDFRLSFRRGEPLQIERESGARDDLGRELRARGLYVLGDDEPLAVAHREVKRLRAGAERERA